MIYLLTTIARLAHIPPALLIAVCTVESGLNPAAINPDDGVTASHGLCQMKLRTARGFVPNITKEELYDPEYNAWVAAMYLKSNLKRYHGDMKCAIAAYNAGHCRRNERGLIKNRKYVGKVLKIYGRHADHQSKGISEDKRDISKIVARHKKPGRAGSVDFEGPGDLPSRKRPRRKI